jgi:hypothetical protein
VSVGIAMAQSVGLDAGGWLGGLAESSGKVASFIRGERLGPVADNTVNHTGFGRWRVNKDARFTSKADIT